ncbi:hypothetical protein ACPA9J_32050 [Pseudomonas aeruginosa]
MLLGVRREDGYLRLEVWDQGPGIPPDEAESHLRRVQAPGQPPDPRGERPRSRPGDRRPVCKVLGHPLEVRSWPGKGSVFSVRVPLARQAPPALANGHKAEPAQALNGAQVLCVDNEDSILAGMNSLLSRWGCQVWTARSREECATLLDGRDAPATGVDRLSPGRRRDRYAIDGLAAHAPGRAGAGRGDQRRRAAGTGGGDPRRRPRLPVQAGQAGRVAGLLSRHLSLR